MSEILKQGNRGMILKSRRFGSEEEVILFVEDNNIVQGNIQSLSSTGYFGGFVMFYWGEDLLKNEGTTA